ncbi:MMPL family transporter [Ralstonia sp. SM1879_UCD539_Tz21]|uniref:MMPL family transporter n=1 Tax=Ralstonia pseudosolanacearum TaxID=1310165 RepID=UPI003394797B
MPPRPSTGPDTHRPRALRQPAVLLWLLGLLACVAVIVRASFVADLSAFLPSSPSAEQRVLVDQLRDGLVSRLMLVAIEGGEPPVRAELSRRMAATLRGDARFASVSNGEPVGRERDQRFVVDHRYLLSPAVTPQRFSADGLHQALGDSLDLLSSSAGLVAKAMLPHDPTGEVAALVSQLDSSAQPPSRHGVWVSRDGRRAVLVAQTAGAGADTDAQAGAMAAVRGALEAAARAQPDATACRLLMTGPGVFAVDTRDTIRHDVERLSTLSLALIVALLFVVYRSPRTLALGLLPVLSGVAAGVASVSLAFGAVHGLTLGFGTTLIGEAVDYSIYLFVQSAQPGVRRADAMRGWIAEYWPTIRLGVLTSVCGFASMLFSGFPGLVQLGLYSIAGLATAALVTRFVLPHLRGGQAAIRDVSRLGAALARAARAAPRLRWPLAALLVAACAGLALHHDRLWNRELAALSPVPAQSQALDASLRADAGAPDVRYLVVISGAGEQAVLEGAEKVSAQLQPLVDAGVLGGYDSPARFLPSEAAQRARLASLPSADALAARLRAALVDQPIRVKPERFAPFLADVEAARHQPLLTRADLRGTSMALAVDALLTERAGRWSAMLPLRASADAQARSAGQPGLDTARVRAAVERAGVPDALFIDMKAEADRLYVNYVREDIRLSLAGVGAIALLLAIALRSARRAMLALAPLAAAVLMVAAGFALAGVPLTILHLIGMLLIVAVGSNYALFFSRRADASAGAQPVTPQTLVSLLIANLATVAGFGLLALSRVPMLETFGLTVGPGAILALVFAAILAPAATQATAPAPTHPRHGDPA